MEVASPLLGQNFQFLTNRLRKRLDLPAHLRFYKLLSGGFAGHGSELACPYKYSLKLREETACVYFQGEHAPLNRYVTINMD